MKEKSIIVYVTYPNAEDAKRISKTLIADRLVACANIFQPHQSLYWWDGAVQDESEVAVIYKTKQSLFSDLKNKINDLHPYDVPCIVQIDITDGHSPFLEWIKEQTI